MKPSRRAFVISASAIGLCSFLSVAISRAGGADIEYSPPSRSIELEKPMTARDLAPRKFNFQKDGDATSSDLSASGLLPPPDQGARARAFIELLGRTGDLDLGADLRDLPGLSLDNTSLPGTGDSDGALDDLFKRPNTRSERGGGRSDNSGGNPFDSPGTDSDRTWSDRTLTVGSGADGDDRESLSFGSSQNAAENQQFLQGLKGSAANPRDGRERDDWLPRREAGPGARGTSWRTGSAYQRDSRAEGDKTRGDRMDAFRNFLSPTISEGAGVAETARTAPEGPSLGAGLGSAPTARGTLVSPAAGGQGFLPDPLGGGNRLPVVRSRLSDAGVGAVLGGGRTGTRPADPEPVTASPMEIMLRKHDTRIPGRVF